MSVSDYKFNNMSNLLEDSCTLSQRNVQNSSASTYMTQNFYPACPKCFL